MIAISKKFTSAAQIYDFLSRAVSVRIEHMRILKQIIQREQNVQFNLFRKIGSLPRCVERDEFPLR